MSHNENDINEHFESVKKRNGKEARRRRKEIIAFSKKIPKEYKFWWMTQTDDNKLNIKYASIGHALMKSKGKGPGMPHGKMGEFLETIKDKFPGDKQLLRELKLKLLFKKI